MIYKVKMFQKYLLLIIVISLFNCKKDKTNSNNKKMNKIEEQVNSFKTDYDFLRKYTDIVLLEDKKNNGKVAISPRLQGRVMTSTARGWSGKSYGWINKKHFISGDTLDHINIYGGEERLWFGPEGGQYSIFFKKGDAFTLDNWYTPKLIDLEPFDLVNQTASHVLFSKNASLTNYSGFTFNFNIERFIAILSKDEIDTILEITPSDKISAVGYQTKNTLKNIGDKPWQKKNGLLSIWLLSMFNHTPTTTVVIPYKSGDESKLGPVVIDDYFGKVPSDRLKVNKNAIFFKADGQQRGKIGLSPKRSTNIIGSYDSKTGTLTILKFNKPANENDYVNSKWEIQKEPYKGDVINSYNDGPPEPGASPLGPFYELETSSAAAALGIGEKITHEQYTFHFEGEITELNAISIKILGVTLEEISNVFK